MKIVIIDNDTSILRSLELVLRADGHEVVTFSNPKEMLFHVIRKERVDVLLTDYSMPEMNGDELICRLEKDPSFRCKIILMSAHTDLVNQIDSEALHIDRILAKPIDIHQLKDAIYN
ncbi:response regulator [Verrucomicrobia bacterium S94]|nr:response regulator [Verrucomicrobia bacterium S94]